MKKAATIIFLLFMTTAVSLSVGRSSDFYWLSRINEPPEEYAVEQIYSKGDILYCTGNSSAAIANNRGADLIAAGDYQEAEKIFTEALAKAPLFFPFRYNLGLCFIYLNRFDHALIHLRKAEELVPEYYLVNLQIGYIYNRLNRENLAIDNFRAALRKNRNHLDTLILMGDLFFERKQLASAQQYYRAALAENPSFPNGLLGLAKIHFANEDYVRAMVLLRSINISGDYDKSLHYYFGESAFRTGDYALAVKHYEELLKHRQDRFFLTHSILLINHKLSLARQFIE